MRFSQIQTGTKILGAFALVSLAIVLIAGVALWRMGFHRRHRIGGRQAGPALALAA